MKPDPGSADHPVYAVALANHVTLLLTRDETAGALDVIEVLAQRGEIADRLVLSGRTVESHIYRAMQKLGISDRRDL